MRIHRLLELARALVGYLERAEKLRTESFDLIATLFSALASPRVATRVRSEDGSIILL